MTNKKKEKVHEELKQFFSMVQETFDKENAKLESSINNKQAVK